MSTTFSTPAGTWTGASTSGSQQGREAAANIPHSAFRNEHLSVSRLKLYEQCALAFYFRYVLKGPRDDSGEAAAFGVTLHLTLELLYQWVVDEEFRGQIPEAELIRCYREAWNVTQLASLALYNEGLAILRAYVRVHGHVDAWDVVALEQEFNLEIEGFKLNGFIDRVDRVEDDHIAIIDYKSNRQLFTKDELENDLQMSVYGLAARQLWPWAKKVSFVFHMLRHNEPQRTERTAREIDDAAGYVVALGKRTERADQTWEPRLNANCGYCDSRSRCPKWKEALASKHESARIADLEGLEDLAREYDRLSKLAKYAYARSKELGDVLRAKLAKEGEFETAGIRFKLIQPQERSFELDRVAKVFAEYGLSRGDVEKAVVRVAVGEVDKLRLKVVEEKQFTSGQATYLETKLAAAAELVPGTPKLDVKPVQGKKTARAVAAKDTIGDKSGT